MLYIYKCIYIFIYTLQMHNVLKFHTVHMDLLLVSSDNNLNSNVRVSFRLAKGQAHEQTETDLTI